MKKRYLAVIPARYQSSRFEGKPLAKINNKPMVVWVYEAVKKSELFDRVVVATDDDRIAKAVEEFGGESVMTSALLANGTQRVAQTIEILENKGENYDVVVNIQGDEPLIKREMITKVVDAFADESADIVTLKKLIENPTEVEDKNVVKVVCSKDRAMYFSRSKIPCNRDISIEKAIEEKLYYKHIGIYAYRTKALKEIVRLEESDLERVEKLEQLRWLENGYNIIVKTTEEDTVGVDTKEDLERVIEIINKNK